jgi:hypothetical protein
VSAGTSRCKFRRMFSHPTSADSPLLRASRHQVLSPAILGLPLMIVVYCEVSSKVQVFLYRGWSQSHSCLGMTQGELITNGSRDQTLHIDPVGTTENLIATQYAQTQVLLSLGNDLEELPFVRSGRLRFGSWVRQNRMRRRNTAGCRRC